MRRPGWTPNSFRGQIIISTVCLVGFAMVLLSLGVQLVLKDVVSNNVDRVLEDRADAVVSAADAASGDRLTVPTGALDPGIVVYDESGALVAGSVSPRLTQDLVGLRTVRTARTVNHDGAERLLAVPFETQSSQRGVVVVTERLAPYEEAEHYALLASIALGIIVIAAAGLIARWVTGRALAPVAKMASRAADWSEHDLGHRFELGEPTNEISALGATLDHLLDRVAMTINAEQRLTSELAHELRTPLASVQGAADLALLRGGLPDQARVDLEQIAASSRVMGETITLLLDLARSIANPLGTATTTLADVVDAVATLDPAGMLAVVQPQPDGATRIAAPLDLVIRALSPVVENAVRHARSGVTLTAEATAGHVDICIEDDGDGVPPEDREAIFSPGSTGSGHGTGLGLGIARRTARSIGGDVSIGEAAKGARFVVRLPRV